MAHCGTCNKRLQDGFVFVSPINAPYLLSSDVHRKSLVYDIATGSTKYQMDNNICGKCTCDLVAYTDELIAEAEACNTRYIKFLTDLENHLPNNTQLVCTTTPTHLFYYYIINT